MAAHRWLHLHWWGEVEATATATATATTTTSRRRAKPVIDGGSRGRVGVATQVAGASCVDVAEADTYA